MSTLPEKTATYRQSFATHPRPTAEEDDLYRSSCVAQAVDRARMAGGSPVTAPEVTETATRLTVTFGTYRTVKLRADERRETDGLREAWTLS